MFHGYRVKLYPTEAQRKRLFELLDASRFCYNWALAYEKEKYAKTGKFTLNYSMYDALKEAKANDSSLNWLSERKIPNSIQRLSIDKVVSAYIRFFKKQCKYPKFKSRKTYKKSFPVRSDRIYFNKNTVSMEGMGHGNRIYCADHHVPIGKRYYNTTVSFDGDDFWLSFGIKLSLPIEFEPQEEGVGIDLGVRKTATLSNGKIYYAPDTSKLERRKRRIDKRVSRDMHKRLDISMRTITKYENVPKSKNQLKREKARRKVIRRICNIHNDFIERMTTDIARMNFSYIVLEDIRVRELQKKADHFTRGIIGNARFRTIRIKLEQKCSMRGTKVYIADAEFPSSQICSNCGFRQNIGVAKFFRCPECGTIIDRDLNAAINLRDYPKTHRV